MNCIWQVNEWYPLPNCKLPKCYHVHRNVPKSDAMAEIVAMPPVQNQWPKEAN